MNGIIHHACKHSPEDWIIFNAGKQISFIFYLTIGKDTSGEMLKENFVPLTHSTTVTENCGFITYTSTDESILFFIRIIRTK